MQLGFVSAILGDLTLEEVLAFASELALTAPLAVAGMKRIFRGELAGISHA